MKPIRIKWYNLSGSNIWTIIWLKLFNLLNRQHFKFDYYWRNTDQEYRRFIITSGKNDKLEGKWHYYNKNETK